MQPAHEGLRHVCFVSLSGLAKLGVLHTAKFNVESFSENTIPQKCMVTLTAT